jgi:phage shock protein A
LQKGEERLAREALTRRKSYLETEAAMSAQLEQQAQVVEQLRQNMRKLESKISEAKAKKDLFVARARSAQASERLNEILGNTSTGSALNAFEQMEDQVMQLEARSQAMAELSGNDLEKQFDALEADDNDVDAELAAMKAKMLPGNNNQ